MDTRKMGVILLLMIVAVIGAALNGAGAGSSDATQGNGAVQGGVATMGSGIVGSALAAGGTAGTVAGNGAIGAYANKPLGGQHDPE